MNFTKMHGAGNDYVYVNCFSETVADPAGLAVEISDRHFGVGSDGLILILPSTLADVRMRMFNADGSEAEMCGNGIRCVAKFAYENDLARKTPLTVETGAGVLSVELFPEADGRVNRVRVDMGAPRLLRGEIPVQGGADEQAINIEFEVAGMTLHGSCVSMGNPHCVIFVEDVAEFPIHEIGPLIETHELFPNRINVEFVQVVSPREVRQRTWERGAGETLACGTGASAVTVAGVLTGRTERKIVNHLAGGDLELEWLESGSVMLVGPAAEVYRGEYLPR